MFLGVHGNEADMNRKTNLVLRVIFRFFGIYLRNDLHSFSNLWYFLFILKFVWANVWSAILVPRVSGAYYESSCFSLEGKLHLWNEPGQAIRVRKIIF